MAKAARPSSDLQSGDKLIARPVLTKRELQSVGPRRVLRARQLFCQDGEVNPAAVINLTAGFLMR